ncbi:MAG: SprT-like domain-containing protein, partial [Deltaproteobacteria bacterium]
MALPIDEAARSTLELLAVRELAAAHAKVNWDLFGSRLRAPQFRLIDTDAVLGRWSGEARCIEMSRTLLFDQSWAVVVEVLKHEMAHQYVDEVLGKHEEQAHGLAFRQVCRQFHIDARAAGMPEGEPDADR